jgi:hypothetical protein
MASRSSVLVGIAVFYHRGRAARSVQGAPCTARSVHGRPEQT